MLSVGRSGLAGSSGPSDNPGAERLQRDLVEREGFPHAAGDRDKGRELHRLDRSRRGQIGHHARGGSPVSARTGRSGEALQLWPALEHALDARHEFEPRHPGDEAHLRARRWVGEGEADRRLAETGRNEGRVHPLERVSERLLPAGSKCREHGDVHREAPCAVSDQAGIDLSAICCKCLLI
jgi:hypothetical protein